MKLYDKASSGKIKEWSIHVESGVIVTRHGYVGGKIQESRKTIASGKNLGKSNATTPHEQAVLESASKVKRQLDKGYVKDLTLLSTRTLRLPMLAKTFYPSWHEDVVKGYLVKGKLKKRTPTKLPKNALGSAKRDGIFATFSRTGKCTTITSRTGKDFTGNLWHLAREVGRYMISNEIWVGELYVHGWSFDRINKAVKNESIDSYSLQFHLFDIPSLDRPYQERAIMLEHYQIPDDYIVIVTTVKINNESVLKSMHDYYVNQGYEGLVIKNGNSKYIWKHRTPAFLKYKEFIDEEFKIIGYKCGTGNDAGAIVFVCHIGGKRDRCLPKYSAGSGYFDCRPRGSVLDRRTMYDVGWTYVGKMLTVRYQARSVYNVPIFPVGLPSGTVRDYE